MDVYRKSRNREISAIECVVFLYNYQKIPALQAWGMNGTRSVAEAKLFLGRKHWALSRGVASFRIN